MKVLIVTLHYLDGNGGGVYASSAFVNAIASLARETYLIYPSKNGENLSNINPMVRTIPVFYKKNKILKFIDVLCGRVHRFADMFENEVRMIKPDVVVFDNSRSSYRLIDIAKKNGSKVITIHHNFEYEYNRDNTAWYLKKILLYWTKKYECDAVKKSDLNLTLTPQDKRMLADCYNQGDASSFEVLGIFEYKKSTLEMVKCSEKKEAKRFVITGNLSAKQTVDSLVPWLDVYFPILKRKFPKASLTIAGKSPSLSLVRKCLELGVNLVPSPQSMRDVLNDADVYICPVALGGGIKLRVMDGLKYGMPVLTHEVSARGYETFVEKKVIYTYRDLKSFERCLDEIAMLQIKKENVIGIYETLFSFDEGQKKFADILNRINR